MTAPAQPVEAVARALCVFAIRQRRRWDTPADEVEAMIAKGDVIDIGWRDFVGEAEAALAAFHQEAPAVAEAVAEYGMKALPEDVCMRMEREARNLSNLWANGDKPVRRAALALQVRTYLAALPREAPAAVALTRDDQKLLDKALMASTEHLYDLASPAPAPEAPAGDTVRIDRDLIERAQHQLSASEFPFDRCVAAEISAALATQADATKGDA